MHAMTRITLMNISPKAFALRICIPLLLCSPIAFIHPDALAQSSARDLGNPILEPSTQASEQAANPAHNQPHAQPYSQVQGQWASPAPRRIPSPRTSQATGTPENHFPSNENLLMQLRLLDQDMRYLSLQSQDNVLEAVVAFATAGIGFVTGALVPSDLAAYLYVASGSAVARGIIELAIPTGISGDYLEFSHMPQLYPQDAQNKIAFGEHAFSGVATRSMIKRILSGSINIASGIVTVPVYLAPKNFRFDTPVFDYIIMITSGLSVLMGLITIFSPTEAEKRWSAYEESIKRQRSFSLEWNIVPNSGGGYVGITGRF